MQHERDARVGRPQPASAGQLERERRHRAGGEIVQAPLVKAYILQVRADYLKTHGFDHPMGPDWNGIHDFDPGKLTRPILLDFLSKVTPEMVLAVVPHGTPKRLAQVMKAYLDAGVEVPNFLDYGGMAGLKYAARSPQKMRDAEDELMRLLGG